MGASRLRGCCSGRLSLACTVGNLFLRCASAQTLDDDLARRALEGKFAVCVQVSRLFSQVEAVDNASAAEILIALDAVSPREGERLLNLLGGYGSAIDQLLCQQSGDVRCRHGGAALVVVAELSVIRAVEAIHGQGENVLTRCRDVNPRTVVRERCSRASLGGCANGDDAPAVGGCVLGSFRVAVTRCGDHECALGAGNVDGALVCGGAGAHSA